MIAAILIIASICFFAGGILLVFFALKNEQARISAMIMGFTLIAAGIFSAMVVVQEISGEENEVVIFENEF